MPLITPDDPVTSLQQALSTALARDIPLCLQGRGAPYPTQRDISAMLVFQPLDLLTDSGEPSPPGFPVYHRYLTIVSYKHLRCVYVGPAVTGFVLDLDTMSEEQRDRWEKDLAEQDVAAPFAACRRYGARQFQSWGYA